MDEKKPGATPSRQVRIPRELTTPPSSSSSSPPPPPPITYIYSALKIYHAIQCISRDIISEVGIELRFHLEKEVLFEEVNVKMSAVGVINSLTSSQIIDPS